MCEVLRVGRCVCFGSSVFNMPAWWQMLNAKRFHNVFLKDLGWEKGDAVTESWFVFDQHCLVPGFHEPGALGWTLHGRLRRVCAIQTHQLVHQLAVPYTPCTTQHPSMDPVSLNLYACVCLHLRKTFILLDLFMIILHDRLLCKSGVAEAQQTALLSWSGACHYGNKLYYIAVFLPCVQLQSKNRVCVVGYLQPIVIVHFIWDVLLLPCWYTVLFVIILLWFCAFLDNCVVDKCIGCTWQNTM